MYTYTKRLPSLLRIDELVFLVFSHFLCAHNDNDDKFKLSAAESHVLCCVVPLRYFVVAFRFSIWLGGFVAVASSDHLYDLNQASTTSSKFAPLYNCDRMRTIRLFVC